MNKREALSRVALFAKLNEKHLDKLADRSVPKTFPKDTLLIREGTVGLGMFVITSGRVEVYKGEGDERTTLGVLESGTIVGEMALVNDEYRSANVRALEPTECLLVSRDAFHTMIREEPEVAFAIMAVLAERIRSNSSKIQELQSRVNETVAEVKETSAQGWSTESESPRAEPRWDDGSSDGQAGTQSSRRTEDPLHQMREAQKVMLRASAELMGTWMGMVGTLVGGVARMTDSSLKSARTGLEETTHSMPRRYFESFSGAIDEGLKAYEDVVGANNATREEAKV